MSIDVVNALILLKICAICYDYAVCFHPGYLLCRHRLQTLESLTNNQVKMRIDKINDVKTLPL